MIDDEYGYLTILDIVRVKGKHTKAKCQCICGSIKLYRLSAVKSGNSTSCNCKRSTNISKSLPHYRRLFSIWDNMKGRCYRPSNSSYKWYGGIGITVCNEWRFSFHSFYDWAMSNGYNDSLVLDKDELCVKNNIFPKLYSPKTCQWVTQDKNLRKEW